MTNSFSKNLRTFRRLRGITQITLSRALCVARTTISAWENGLSEPDFCTLKLIKDYLGVSYDDLLED